MLTKIFILLTTLLLVSCIEQSKPETKVMRTFNIILCDGSKVTRNIMLPTGIDITIHPIHNNYEKDQCFTMSVYNPQVGGYKQIITNVYYFEEIIK
jgi:hypothetical protein